MNMRDASWGGGLAALLIQFSVQHLTGIFFSSEYGPPEENEVKEMPTSLKSQLIQIEISSSEKTFSKKVPYNMSVQKLSGLIQRLFNTGSTIPHLSCIHAEVYSILNRIIFPIHP